MKNLLINFLKMANLLLVLLAVIAGCGGQKQQKQRESETNETKGKAYRELVKYGIDTSKLVPQGLAKGDAAPSFSVVDSKGDSIHLTAILKDQPVVLMFYRGQWCPVCNKYLQRLEDSVKLIREAGARILAVTPETPPNVAKMRKKTNTSLTIIPDTAQAIMKAYQVGFDVTGAYARKIENGFDVSIAENNGDQKARLPIPATYVISQDGEIKWRFFNPNYKRRASVKAMLKALEKHTKR